MNYDLTDKEERKRFIRRANILLAKQRNNVSLVDESTRTLKQNSYLHILCRIMACETGVTEAYAKQVYFKRMANRDIFCTVSKDSITGSVIEYYRSTKDITLPEMRRAITNFRRWAEDNGYHLPEAIIKDDGSMEFASKQDEQAYHQALIMTSKQEEFL